MLEIINQKGDVHAHYATDAKHQTNIASIY
jgi:hypothetical protein